MRTLARTILGLAAIAAAALGTAGCASTRVDRNPIVTEKIPRPATIWVPDFAATPADLPADSFLAGQNIKTSAPQTDQDKAEGRKLGSQIAMDLVSRIQAMGMNARHETGSTSRKVNDLVIRGYLISYNEGSQAERVGIGFGSGNADLKVAVEGFQVTPQGLRKLGEGTTEAEGNKAPGAAAGGAMFLVTHNPVGLIVSTGMKAYQEKSGSGKIEGRAEQTAQKIADILRQRFQQQGWIQ